MNQDLRQWPLAHDCADCTARGLPSELELGRDGLPERLLDRLEGDPVVDVGEEALDDQPDGGLARHAARLGVEDHVLVDPAGRGAVGAADVVGLDLQAGDRVGAGGVREHQVVVLLVGVGALGVLLDPDHPLPDDPRLVLEARLVEQVAGRVGAWWSCRVK